MLDYAGQYTKIYQQVNNNLPQMKTTCFAIKEINKKPLSLPKTIILG